MKKGLDAREDAKEKDDEDYVAFPGGIPKRWLDPAVAIFLLVSPCYTVWVVMMEVWTGVTAGAPAVDIAGAIWTHLSEFLFGFPILILIGCKILERIMYYLDVKKLNADYRKRLDETERRAEEAIRRAEAAERRAEKAEQHAEDYRQSAEAYRQSAEDYRQSAETYRQRAKEAESEKERG